MRFTLTALMVAVVFIAPSVRAGDVLSPSPDQPLERKPLPASWKWSLAPLVASQTLDIASSYGMRELNPVLAGPRGQFGGQAAMVKIGVTGAFIGIEYLIVKAHPKAARFFTKINWSGAVLTTSFAAHNFAIR